MIQQFTAKRKSRGRIISRNKLADTLQVATRHASRLLSRPRANLSPNFVNRLAAFVSPGRIRFIHRGQQFG
jgi:hypothetical protein